MNSAGEYSLRRSVSGWLLLTLVAAQPLMKPAIVHPLVAADAVFLLLATALAIEIAKGARVVRWHAAFTVLLAYVACLAPSMLATSDLGESALKLATEAYLAGLTVVVIVLVGDERMLRRIVLAWLASTVVLILLAVAAIIAFLAVPEGTLYAYARFHSGTLPPGHYPRLALTFLNANMACNYLTVSLGLLFVAWRQGWIRPAQASLLLGGILVAAAATISPGLGGIALALGTGIWLRTGSRAALLAGAGAALAFLLVAALTPILHPTAPFVIHLGGATLAPSGRFLTWSDALGEFLRHPIAGHGIGIDAVSVLYRDPSGNLQHLGDAHNALLSIAAQAGIIGLAGFGAIIVYAVRVMRSGPIAFALGTTFLNAFLYQGLTGSFEDARHLWLLFGLLVAAAGLPVSPPGGNNRRAAAPSPC